MSEKARAPLLSAALASALRPVEAAARAEGVRIALVGGVVRDRLRGAPAGHDVDVAVEGDAARLAKRVAREVGGRARVRIHGKFGTATVEGGSGWRLDLARARSETYRRPGALPDVRPATLEEDLARRDFAINAIAWEPADVGSRRGRLIDPFGGARDVEKRLLRVLHPQSFEDDPTRILRAVRYANRLGFRLERGTRRLLASALASKALATVSGNRVRRELELWFSEPGWAGALRTAAALGVPAALEPGWRPGRRTFEALVRAEALARRVPGADSRRASMATAGLLVAAADLPRESRARLGRTLGLSGRPLAAFERGPAWGARASREEKIAAAAVSAPGEERRAAERRLLAAPVRLSIRGTDLIGAGVPAGPAVGRALDAARRAREDGRIEPGEELSYALAVAREETPE
ncbi:MAG TPA: hypothetical protein VIW03_17700 [Anaeromyxobacter sp.]